MPERLIKKSNEV
jgi:hypothetical protein